MLQQIWNGLTLGSIYALLAIGYTLVFGILQVVFFAQGELSMLAAFVVLGVVLLLAPFLSPFLTLLVAVLLAILVSVFTGLLAERVALRPLENEPRVKPLITSLGVSIILQNLVMVFIGAQTFAMTNPLPINQYSVLGVRVNSLEFVIIGTLLISVLAINWFLSRTRLGFAVRAVPQSRDGARLMGIPPRLAVGTTFVISSTTAALAGISLALYFGVAKFDMGFAPGIKGFTIAILGGIGNVFGAVVAALLIGVLEAVFAGYFSSDYRDVLVFSILILTLVFRPFGLMGKGQ